MYPSFELTPELQQKILRAVIGILAVLIVGAVAIGVSVIRSQMQLAKEVPVPAEESEPVLAEDVLPEPETESEEEIYQRMQGMHEEGNAEVTEEEMVLMEAMNEAEEYTEEELLKIDARMQRMLEAE